MARSSHIRGRPEHRSIAPSDTARKNLGFDREALARLCRRHHIRRLALFGSVLRRDFGETSDIDVLVEFDPGHTPGLRFFDIQDELSRLFGRRVDLNTPAFLSPRVREEAETQAEVLFESS